MTAYGATVNYTSVGGSNQRGDTIYSVDNQIDQVDFRLCDLYGNVLEAPLNNIVCLEFFAHY
jgi:hypothetical protein